MGEGRESSYAAENVMHVQYAVAAFLASGTVSYISRRKRRAGQALLARQQDSKTLLPSPKSRPAFDGGALTKKYKSTLTPTIPLTNLPHTLLQLLRFLALALWRDPFVVETLLCLYGQDVGIDEGLLGVYSSQTSQGSWPRPTS